MLSHHVKVLHVQALVLDQVEVGGLQILTLVLFGSPKGKHHKLDLHTTSR